MAKSKPKKVKRPPPRVVVVNPWSSDSEDISAWFELMLRDHGYPDTRANIIFHRKNNGSKIVELPKDVKDISMCLGTHYHSNILKDRPHSADFSVIYEYKNSYAEDPGENNWTEVYPSNREIPANFPVKYPYPLPLPHQELSATSVDAEYACFPSAENKKRMDERWQKFMQVMQTQAQSQSTPVASTSVTMPTCGSSFATEPSSSSSTSVAQMDNASKSHNLVSDLTREHSKQAEIKKMDPYEEEEVMKELFRSLSPVKSEADNFLGSVLNRIKIEDPSLELQTTHVRKNEAGDEDDYQPSAELLAMFDTLNDSQYDLTVEEHSSTAGHIKPEPIESEIPNDDNTLQEGSTDDYQPSAELLALFDKSQTDVHSSQSSGTTINIKPEPIDYQLPPFEGQGFSSRDQSGTASQVAIVKLEQYEYSIGGVLLTSSEVYPGDGHIRSRDPRLVSRVESESDIESLISSRTVFNKASSNVIPSKAPVHNGTRYSTGRSNKRLESDDLRDRESSPAKRIKTEFGEG